MSAIQKVYKDTEKTVTLWGLGHDGGITLTFTEEQLKCAGWLNSLNIMDLQSVFQCDVTIQQVTKQTVRYSERKERFLKPLKDSS